MTEENKIISRRNLLKDSFWGASLAALGAVAGFAFYKNKKTDLLWQIDPYKCVACGNCATYCVLEESAVKCIQAFEICGYCDLCPGYLEPTAKALDTGAENELCPTGAIRGRFLEHRYYE